MGFTSKEILANLDKKYSSRNPQYLMDGKRMIDEAVAKAEVDGTFFEEYCTLKKKLELDKQVVAIAVSIIGGLTVSFAFDLLLETVVSWLSAVVQIAGYLLILIVGTGVSYALIRKFLFNNGHFLKSYLLHRMEAKLDEDAHLHTDDRES